MIFFLAEDHWFLFQYRKQYLESEQYSTNTIYVTILIILLIKIRCFVPTPRVNKKSCVVISGGHNQMLFFPSESNGVVFRKKKVTLSAFDRECTLSQVRENQEGIQN